MANRRTTKAQKRTKRLVTRNAKRQVARNQAALRSQPPCSAQLAFQLMGFAERGLHPASQLRALGALDEAEWAALERRQPDARERAQVIGRDGIVCMAC